MEGDAARAIVDHQNDSLLERRLRDTVQTRSWRMVCQSIISLDNGEVLGYEALARPVALEPLDSPATFLALAARIGLEQRVSALWRADALASFAKVVPAGSLLFLNISPGEFTSNAVRATSLTAEVVAAGLYPGRIVLELTEGDRVPDFGSLRRALGSFRSAGFLIAIDDVGAGPSSLQAIAELRPNFIKLDRWLATGIAFDGVRRSIAESMVELARRTRARVIAEGIETVEQLQAFARLGIEAGQGYYFGTPQSEPAECHADAKAEILKAVRLRAERAAPRTLGAISVAPLVVPHNTTGKDLLELFEAEQELAAVVVECEGGDARIVSRERLLRIFAAQFGPSLHSKRSALELSSGALAFPATTLIREAARAVVRRQPGSRVEPVIVTHPDGSVGIIEALDLLQAALEEEVFEARHSNPLTGLPGNRRIREFFELLTDRDRARVAVYVDIDRFKQFNDRFGFAAGDLAITRLAGLLQEAASVCDGREFIGHIGGDDFVLAIPLEHLAAVRARIEQACAARWFDPDHLTECPDLTVTFAGINLADLHGSYEDQAEALARFKARLKGDGGARFEVAVSPSEMRLRHLPWTSLAS